MVPLGILTLAIPSALAQTGSNASAPDVDANPYQARQIVPFLEPTDVFLAPGGGTNFEANIFPHLVIYQNFIDAMKVDLVVRDANDKIGTLTLAKKRRAFYWSVTGTPAVRLREYREVSAPVRTPSYMPKGTIQFFVPRRLQAALNRFDNVRRLRIAQDRNTLSREEESSNAVRVDVLEFHGTLGHHSNGQDGCLFTYQQRAVGSDACTPDVVPQSANAAQASINRHDGSFSTNYIRAGVNYRWNWLSLEDAVTARDLTVGAEVEVHPAAWMDSNEVQLYGRTRVNTVFGVAQRGVPGCVARFEVSGGVKFIIGAPETVPPTISVVQASCFPGTAGGWGFYGRYYYGQDYYNLGFLDRRNQFEIGATFNQDGFFRFLLRRSAGGLGLVR
jgi:hypothetical protein